MLVSGAHPAGPAHALHDDAHGATVAGMDAPSPHPADDDRGLRSAAPEPADLPVLDDAHLLTRGRHADVYLLDDRRVLRRLHRPRDPHEAYPGADLVRFLHAEGFPTARVLSSTGSDLVMERLHGPTLLQALDAGEVSIPDGVDILVALHERLHALALPPGAPQEAVASDHRVVHLDLHPGTILLTATGPQLIDWDSAGYGPPDLDLATTALVLGEIVADAEGYARPALAMLRRLTAATGPGYGAQLDAALALRAAHPTLDEAERRLLPTARDVVAQEVARVRAR